MPTLLPDDSTDCAAFLASCWQWTIRAAQWQSDQGETVDSSVKEPSDGSCGNPTAVLRRIQTQEDDIDTVILNGNDLVEFFSLDEKENASMVDRYESRRCIILGLLYGCIAYQQILDDQSIPPSTKSQWVSRVPSRIQLSLVKDLPVSSGSDSLLQLLDLLWSKLNDTEASNIAKDIIAFVCNLSARFNQLDQISRHRFLGGIFAWSFYRCVNNENLIKAVADPNIDSTSEDHSFTPSFGLALVHLILQLPTSTFTADINATLINNLCEFLLGSTGNGDSPFLLWLSNKCCLTADDQSTSTFYIALAVLLFWRALSWVRVDGISAEALSASNAQQPAEGLSSIAVTARQRAVRVVTMMWSFSPAKDKNEVDDGTQSDESPGPISETNNAFLFREFVCLLMGRQLVYLLSDVGRISEVNEILQSLTTPCQSEWMALIESAERGEEFSRIPKEFTTEKNQGHRKALYQILTQSFALSNFSPGDRIGKTNDAFVQKSIGLSFDAPVPSAPNLQKPLPPPRIASLLEVNGKKGRPITLLALMLTPPWIELQSMMVELPTLNSLTYLSSQVGKIERIECREILNVENPLIYMISISFEPPFFIWLSLKSNLPYFHQAHPQTLRQHFNWLMTYTTHQRPLDRLLLRLPTIFPLLSYLHIIKRKTFSTSKEPTLTPPISWGDSLFNMNNLTSTSPITPTESGSSTPEEPINLGITDSEVCRQLFLAVESSASYHFPTAVSRARSALVEPLIFRKFNDALRIHLQRTDQTENPQDQDSSADDTVKLDTTESQSSETDNGETQSEISSPETSTNPPSQSTKIHEYNAIPSWSLCRILQRNCLNSQSPIEFDMICTWIYQMTLPTDKQSSPLKLNDEFSSTSFVHPILPSLLNFLSLSILRWSEQIGPSVQLSLILSLFEFSIQQLCSSSKLPSIDLSLLPSLTTTRHPSLTSYYTILCKETLVGRLLIFSGIEPQFIIPPRQSIHPRGTLWLHNSEARKLLRFPLCGVSILEELGFNEAPFVNALFPVNSTLR